MLWIEKDWRKAKFAKLRKPQAVLRIQDQDEDEDNGKCKRNNTAYTHTHTQSEEHADFYPEQAAKANMAISHWQWGAHCLIKNV